MNLTQYVDDLRRELLVAAEAGGEEARILAERLTAPLESAARLVLLEALSAAANEITRDLAPGSVDVRLRGRDPEFVVTSPPANQAFEDIEDRGVATPTRAGGAPPADAEEGSTTRTTLRLPEQLKLRVEDAAGREGLSVNTWLVRTVAAAVESGRRPGRDHSGGQRFTGWVS